MSISLMIGNGKGWERIGECASTNVGHASDGFGVSTPDGYITFEVGTEVRCYSKAETRTMNIALNAAGWQAHTLQNARTHNGAVLQIDRHFLDDDGNKVWAAYRRTH